LSLADASELPALVAEEAQPGDMVVCLGAGTITQWANSLAEALKGREAA